MKVAAPARAGRVTHLGHTLPKGWVRTGAFGPSGATYRQPTSGMTVIESVADQHDGHDWLHVSCSYPNRLPTYADLNAVKRIFIGDGRQAIQLFPRASEHINIHPYVLHLFCCLTGEPVPDFTRGSGSI